MKLTWPCRTPVCFWHSRLALDRRFYRLWYYVFIAQKGQECRKAYQSRLGSKTNILVYIFFRFWQSELELGFKKRNENGNSNTRTKSKEYKVTLSAYGQISKCVLAGTNSGWSQYSINLPSFVDQLDMQIPLIKQIWQSYKSLTIDGKNKCVKMCVEQDFVIHHFIASWLYHLSYLWLVLLINKSMW